MKHEDVKHEERTGDAVKLQYPNRKSLEIVARSRRFDWIHALMIAVLLVLVVYACISRGSAAYIMIAVIVGYLVFDICGRALNETVMKIDPSGQLLVVERLSLGRAISNTEYDLVEVVKFAIEKKDRWGERIALELWDGTLIPLEEGFAENVDGALLQKANRRLDAARVKT